MDTEPRWELVAYSHDEKRGVGVYTYERPKGPGVESRTETRFQPMHAKQLGWHKECQRVLAARTRDEMTYDALFGYAAGAFGGTWN